MQIGVGGMVVCAVLITIAQNVNKTSGGSSSVGVFLIVATLAFVVFFALGGVDFC
jgi:hypothetical protein